MAKKVLMVEDDLALTKAYTAFLTKAGYEVTNVSDGDNGLEKARDEKYDLILLDLLLPELVGIEFLRAYQPKDHPETRVIVFTNLSSPDIVNEATELGVCKYIVKANYSPTEMVHLIKETIG